MAANLMNSRLPAFAVLCLASSLLAQGGELDLRTTAKKGSSVWLAQVQKQEQTIEMMGQEVETSQTITRTIHVKVLEEEGGNLLVETKIARIHGTMAMPEPMGEVEFDSAATAKDEADEDDMTGGMIAQMKKGVLAGAGKSFRAKVTPYGKVVELIGAEELTKQKEDGPSMNKQDLEQCVESAFGILPTKPIAVGGAWDHADDVGSGRMPMQQKLTLTLTKADAESFEITGAGTVEKPADAPAKDEKGEGTGDEMEEMQREMQKNLKLSNGKLTGTCKVSRQDGFVVESTNNVTVDAEMSGQMEMKMAIKIVTTTKRTTEEAAMPKAAPAKDEAKRDEPKKDAGK